MVTKPLAFIQIEKPEPMITQYLLPDRAHEAQQELEYEHGMVCYVVRGSVTRQKR